MCAWYFPHSLPACVCMCWNLGHPLWLCVWEADQSIRGAAQAYGRVYVRGMRSQDDMFLCVSVTQRESTYYMKNVSGCFHSANTPQTETLSLHLYLPYHLPSFLELPESLHLSLTPPLPTSNTCTHTHHFLSLSQGESRKQLEKQIVAGRPSPGPLALTHDWTFTWMNAVLTLIFCCSPKAQGAVQLHKPRGILQHLANTFFDQRSSVQRKDW